MPEFAEHIVFLHSDSQKLELKPPNQPQSAICSATRPPQASQILKPAYLLPWCILERNFDDRLRKIEAVRCVKIPVEVTSF